MDPQLLQDSVATLVQRLGDRVEDAHGFGFMSPAIYDTAWVSMVSKTVNDETIWLFPECFDYILSHQLEDGGWAIYASEIDGILNTAASLLSLKRHFKTPYQITSITQQDIAERIDRAHKALENLLSEWNVDTTRHVGFEILVPALLRYLEEEAMSFSFPGRERLLQIEGQKLARFKAEYLYLPIQSTALHSLEAFIGAIDFNKVGHHKVSGSFMASPSSTAAFLMHTSEWDGECESYLKTTICSASGQGSGGVPSAFPSGIFEITWPISTLLKSGYELNSTTTPSIEKIQKYLHDAFVAEKEIVGFTPFVGADADDTANTILVLGLLNQPVSPEAMLKEFEEEHHFKTYAQERNPSFSANCNVLLALLYTPDPSMYSIQIEKAVRFLYKQFMDSDLDVQDKWNLSPYYSWMLMAQAIARLITLQKNSQLPGVPHDLIHNDLAALLLKIASTVAQRQNTGGSWGIQPSKEETAYAVLTLTYAAHVHEGTESNFNEIYAAINNGSSFLLEKSSDIASERLWVEKVTYRSEVLSDAYVLAALKRVADLPIKEIPHPVANGVSTNGMNGYVTFSNHASENAEESGAITVQTNGNKENGIHHENVEENGAISVQTNGNQENGIYHQNVTQVEEIEAAAITVSNGHADSNGTSVVVHSDYTDSYYHRSEWNSDQEEILLGPFDYLESLPGKNMRSQLIQAFNTWLKVPSESLEIIQRVISMLHTASLLIDDIQDQSLLRRGQPVAHSIFGTAQTMNSGNYIYFIALREIQKLHNPQAINIYVDSLIDLHRGQGMELFWRDSLICPTEEEYLDMVANKTGGLFCLAIQLMRAEATVDVDFVSLVRLLGIIFQICDDYLNLKSTAYTDNKGLCEDLTEGKFSFPIIHSIRANPGNRQLINILKQKPREDDVKRYALSYMESTNSFEYTRNVVHKLKAEALDMIHRLESQGLDENIGIRKILARMSLEL